MLNLKKTAVAVLALGSSAVFAGSMGPVCSAVNVTVPCESTAWDFGAKALYLKASVNSDVGYNPVVADAVAGNINPDYNWGFQIEGSYHFNTGNDLNINWYHLSKSEGHTWGAQSLTSFNNPAILGDSYSVTPQGGSVSTDPRWDAVNFEFGQHVDFGDNKAIRFHGGAQYTRLTNDTTRNAGDLIANLTTPASTSYGHTSTVNRTYNGFGPRLGMDMSYDFGNGLGIYGNGATAILAGTRSISSSYSDTLSNSVGFSNSRTVIVPAVDAKLGATYTYAMAQGDLTLDAGWMWVDYIGVHANVDGNDSNFGLQGPFIGLKWLGNIA